MTVTNTRPQTADPFDAATAARRPQIWSWIGWAVVLVVGAQAVHFVAVNPAFAWPVVWKYFTSADVLRGLGATLQLTAICMTLGILGGLALAAMRLSKSKLMVSFSSTAVWFLRSVPLLVQLIFWYNLAALLPRISIGVPFGPEFASWNTNELITPMAAAIIGLSMHEMAYMAEIIRAGVLGVPEGQVEAALSTGMSRYQMFRRVVLPQAARMIVPPTGSQVISMLKATSLVSVIAMRELLYSVQETYNQTFQVIPLLIVAVLWYLIVTSLLAIGQVYLERTLGRGYGKQGGRKENSAIESPRVDPPMTGRLV